MNARELKEKLVEETNAYLQMIEPVGTMLIGQPWIVKVNDAYTIELDENNMCVLTTKSFPTQYSRKTAEEIVSNLNITNNENVKVVPEIVEWKKFYQERIDTNNKLISLL